MYYARRANQSILEEVSPEYLLEGLSWSWNYNTLTTWCKELTHWKRLWCCEGPKAGGKEDDRGWDVWIASSISWTWVWVSSGSWWWTGKPGVLQSMGSQRVGHDWVTELTDQMAKCKQVQCLGRMWVSRGFYTLTVDWELPLHLVNTMAESIHTRAGHKCARTPTYLS